MKYFTQIIVLLLCITVYTGYEVSAQTTNSQNEELDQLYEDSKSFFELVDESDHVQCKTSSATLFRDNMTSLFHFFGDMTLVDRYIYGYRRQGYNVRALARFNPALTDILAIEDRIQSDTSSLDIALMRGELETLEEGWNSCLENR